MELMDRRSFLRVPFESEAVVASSGGWIEGTMKNLCLAGAFIRTQGIIEPETEVEIEILRDAPSFAASLILDAKVVRHEAEGIAIRFTRMTTDVYKQLEDTVSRIHGDRETVVAEFVKFLNFEWKYD